MLQRVYVGAFAGKPAIYKQRFPKTYRHPTLDVRLNGRRIVQVLFSAVAAHRDA